MAVVDASALIELLCRSALGERIRARLDSDQNPHLAPDLLWAEVLSGLRSVEARGTRSAEQTLEAIESLRRMPIELHPTVEVLDRVWSLRTSLSAYDAHYVALAEAFDQPLVTCDARLGRAHGYTASVEVY